MKIAIFGGAGGGEITAQTLSRLAAAGGDVSLLGYLNDAVPAGTELLAGSVLGPFSSWKSLPNEVLFAAPLHKAKEMKSRAERICALSIPQSRWAKIIDPSAIVARNTGIGSGSIILPLVVVGPSCSLGHHVVCWPASQVGHNVQISDFVFLGRASVISGYCKLGLGCYVGSGAVIREHCELGVFSIVGSGSVVISNVPDFAIVVGNPARVIGVATTELPNHSHE